MAPTMRPLFARILASLGLAAILATPLSAQLDPRMQKDKTDFLDLYQQSNTGTLKPEIVTIFDFTGSMNSIMFHPKYPNTDLTDSDPYVTFTFQLTHPRRSTTYTCTAYLSGYNWNLQSTTMVRPDGTILTGALIDANYVASSPALPGEGATQKSADVRNWIRCLSHVRFTYNGRTLDLPVPWTLLDAPSVQPSATESRKMYNTYPLKMTIKDPGSSTEIEMDTRYRVPGNWIINGDNQSATLDSIYYRSTYLKWLFSSNSAAYIPDATTTAGEAFNNGIPDRTRVTAIKDAAMRTWAKYWNKVYWAYRFINDDDDSQQTTLENQAGSGWGYYSPYVFNDSRDYIPTDPRTTPVYGGAQRGWSLLNGNSGDALQRLAAYQSGGNTPMTYAVGNTLAQLNDPDNIFNDVETGSSKPVDCMKHFLILFTDGFPNTDAGGANVNTPYLTGSAGTTFDANTGNGAIIASPTSIDPSNQWWNPINLAAVAAHLGDSGLTNYMKGPYTYQSAGTYPSSGGAPPDQWLPFWIQSRGSGSDALTFSTPHPIYTMTVGLSMAGSVTDSQSPKHRLLLAAAFGDPSLTHVGDITQLKPFTLTNPNDPTSKDPNSVYFFDATSPQTLVDNLDAAFSTTVALTNSNVASKPTVPFVGLGLASEIYLGTFLPPSKGGPVWSGDLMMFPTKLVNGSTQILTKAGAVATVLDNTTAVWTAADAIYARTWANRRVYTRLPATTSTPNPPLVPFAYRPSSGSTTNFDAIKAYIATSTTYTDDDKNKLIEFVLGADTSSTTTPYPTRVAHPALGSNTISCMGDIVDSAPAAVEYTVTNALKTELAGVSTTLSNALSNTGARFRVIFVGTNQGMLHAFGEVSWTDTTTNPNQPFTTGVVDELWAFVPTDFLAHLDDLQSIKPHRFMVDGSPYVYFLDLAPAGQTVGNGTVDSTETARVIFGLGKGGRSYYALDIHDPCNPAMAWALSPDEVTATPAILDNGPIEASNAAVAKTAVENMGFSSSSLAVGRVEYGSPVVHLRDALFLGGGFSTPAIDTAFGTSLGRSALAVDAANGHILMAWDFLKDSSLSGTATGMGPVGAGVVPFEYFLNSGLVQRAYFTDFNGSLWALGSGANTQASDNKFYRRDTSSLDAWTVDGKVGSNLALRKVYTANAQDVSTTLPSPFLTGNVAPAAGTLPVGIAFSTGNRDNPLDYFYNTTNLAPTRHETMVVFDSQEDTLGGTPITFSDLYKVPDTAATSTTPPHEVVPGDAKYFLANSQRGYEIDFPKPTGGFIPKGINQPLVLGGAMFFSYFNPTSADPCKGGAGTTYANRICDVLSPLYQGNATTVSNSYTGPCVGGNVFSWSGVATNFSARSTVSVNQAGLVSTTSGGSPTLTTQIKTIFGNVRDRMPRPRVWRVVR